MPRAFRFTRRSCGGWRESQLFPAGFRRTINCKRTRETTTFLSWWPLHNRPAGGLWQVPRSVGNPASDTVDKTVHSTTLFQKLGVLRGETPKLTFAYFCSATKVGPRRGGTLLRHQDRRSNRLCLGERNAPPRRARNLPSPASLPIPYCIFRPEHPALNKGEPTPCRIRSISKAQEKTT